MDMGKQNKFALTLKWNPASQLFSWSGNPTIIIITESFELEGTLNDYLMQLPCNAHGHPQLHKVLRAPSPDPGYLQGRGITAFLGSLCDCLTALIIKDFFLISNLNVLRSGSKPFPLVLSRGAFNSTGIKWRATWNTQTKCRAGIAPSTNFPLATHASLQCKKHRSYHRPRDTSNEIWFDQRPLSPGWHIWKPLAEDLWNAEPQQPGGAGGGRAEEE